MSHGVPELAAFDVAHAQAALNGFSVATPLTSSFVPTGSGCLCQDAWGWGPFYDEVSLTPCFVDAAFVLFPTGLLFLAGTYQLVSYAHQKPYAAIKDWKLYFKLALVALQLVFAIGSAILSARASPNFVADISFWAYGLTVPATALALALHYLEHFRSPIPSGSLLFYWLLVPLALVFKVFQLSAFGMFSSRYYFSLLIVAQLFNSALILALEWQLPRAKSAYENMVAEGASPMESADVFSRITFAWMSPLMKQGYANFLTEEDLPEVPREDATAEVTGLFDHHWAEQVKTKSNPSVVIALAKAFGPSFLLAGLFKGIQDTLSFAQPQLLRYLIQFVEEYTSRVESAPGSADSQPLTKGLAIAVLMFVASVLQTAALHQYFQRAFDTGMRIKAALTAAIYEKSLVMSNEERSTQSTGDIVNLMSVDTQRLQDLTQYVQIAWSGPFQIILCLISLYSILGNAMWAGVVVMVVMIPINTRLARIQKRLQEAQMKNKDQRTKLTSEILTNVKSLKLYGWEVPFIERLNHVRNDLELVTLRNIGLFSAITTFLWQCAPFMVSCSTFAVFVYTSDQPLTTDIVFPALTLFSLLSFPLAVVPNVITSMIEASVALQRLQKFFLSEEVQADAVERLPRATVIGEETVSIKNGTFVWERKPEYKVALADINLSVHKGDLSCVVGRVGCGKSSLLQAMLGDLYKVEGHVTIRGTVAYASQVPWVMNATVRENILFGSRYDPEFYNKTIAACALADDLAILPDGDSTMVGEKGISLSGGQKARLSLARAVYARADVYLLDDPLSAVDEHVGRHIIDNVLGKSGLLASKTIVLATNSIPVLRSADRIHMIAHGKIIESGSLSEITERRGAIFQLLTEFGKKAKKDTSNSDASSTAGTMVDEATTPTVLSTSSSRTDIVQALTAEMAISGGGGASQAKARRGSFSTLRRASTASFTKPRFADENVQNKETAEQGKVKWDVYVEYAKACNLWGVLGYMILVWVSQILSVGSGFWLKSWSEHNTETGTNDNVAMYLGVYALLGFSTSGAIVWQTIVLMIYCTIQSAKVLHNKMLQSVMRAPMSFFETTPIGRILNRFSNDIYKVDQVLARTFSGFFGNVAKVILTLAVISYSTPPILFIILPLLYLYLYYQRYYLRTSRELKRLDSVSRSPIYAHFQETLGGISTIRAYDQPRRFRFVNESRIDLNLKAYFPSVSANRWLAVRLELIGAVIIFAAAALSVVYLPTGRLSAGIVGLALSYGLQITQSLNWIVRMTVEVETNIVSVERILEYSRLPSEAPQIIENNRPPAVWPQSGLIKFNNYSTRYREGLPLVLKNIDVEIKPQEKIGIVGRTGAGKSSLTLALFRIIEAAEGHMTIDSIDTSAIGLSDLRHKLSIIPQDSQAFEGTIRDNLDPEGVHDDTELWRVLELSHLKTHVSEMQGGLDGKVTEGGSNLSVGQRQLMCLARALLTPSKILVLDEATAAVDVETDKVLQETIRTEFKDRTILTIAHRLNTIMDSDRIIVLEQGRVKEFDSPERLLEIKDSMFYSLCKQGGFVE